MTARIDPADKIDPTANVIALNEAAVKRQDDLRSASERRVEEGLLHVRELMALRAEHATRFALLRAEHADQLREIEAKRLDAIHDNDSLNARLVADRLANTLETLGRKMTEDREALRSLVDQTARTLATTTSSQFGAIESRLLTMERAFSEDKGKQAVADPMMGKLFEKIEGLLEARAVGVGRSAGVEWGIGKIVTLVTLVSAAVAVASRFVP